MNVQSKINKLCMALKLKGYIYLVNREQFYNHTLEKVCNINKLMQLLTIEEYNRLYPDNKKNPDKYQYVKVEILESFSSIEILLKLVDIYKKAGEKNE